MRMKRSLWALLPAALLLFTACRSEQAVEVAAPPEPEPAPAVEWVDLVPKGKLPMEGVLTGGQPSSEELATLAENGFRTVINLRQPDEKGTAGEEETVEGLGMGYLSIPVAGAEGITEENALALAAALEEAERPVLLHCGSGNRVGALLALMAYHLEGRSAEEALAFGREGGLTRLEPAVRESLEALEGAGAD